MVNADIILNNEKALLAKYILEIDSEELFARVKKSLAGFITFSKPTSSASRTETFLKQVAGKWEDDRSADEMVNDIYKSRMSKSVENYCNPFE